MSGILLTTDLSAASKRAFAPVRDLAKRLGLEITLLSILEEVPFEPTAGGLMAAYPDRTTVERDWRRSLTECVQQIGSDVCKESLVVPAVDVASAIVDAAHARKVDLIAMATHGRTGLRRLLLGSVAERVVRMAHVPVLLYPPPVA